MKSPIIFLLMLFNLNVFGAEIEVMSYNVENLFDTEHDNGKNDWAFLPKGTSNKREQCKNQNSRRRIEECLNLDWDKDALKAKLMTISKVIKSRGKLPDILGIIEIENENVLSMLAKALGYEDYLITNSPDQRGIDVALLFKEKKGLKYITHKEYVLRAKYFNKKPTRNILEVVFKVDDKYPLSVIVNHWPSQSNPDEARAVAAKNLLVRIKKGLQKNPNHKFLVMGDFNTAKDDHPHPFRRYWYKNNFLNDVATMFLRSENVDRKEKSMMPKGTYFYVGGMEWNHLDRFFVTKNLINQSDVSVDVSSFEIYAPSFLTSTFTYTDPDNFLYGTQILRTPKRYNHREKNPAKAGYSDHFPIIVKLKY